MKDGWIGVGYYGVLIKRHAWLTNKTQPAPVTATVERVRNWLNQGRDIRIFADIHPLNRCIEPGIFRSQHSNWVETVREDRAWLLIEQIRRFSATHIGSVLPITSIIDEEMRCLWDCNCEQVEPDTGRRAVDVAFEQGQKANSKG